MPVPPRRQTTYTSIAYSGRERGLLRLLQRPLQSWVMRRQGWIRRGNLWIRRP